MEPGETGQAMIRNEATIEGRDPDGVQHPRLHLRGCSAAAMPTTTAT